MFFIILIFIFFYLAYYVSSSHLHIDWKSLFKRGFKKTDTLFGLYCYTGKQGTGKTYSSINFLIKNKILRDYTIITNVRSFNVFPDTIYMSSLNDIIDFMVEHEKDAEKYIIFFDEIFTILEKGTKINAKILSFISQLRKRKIILVTTAQEWGEINITFRRYVRFQIDCNMFALPFTHTAFLLNRINDGDLIRWDNDAQDWIAPTVSTNFMKGNKSVIESYDTFETIKVTR